jgi:hypothetical protein
MSALPDELSGLFAVVVSSEAGGGNLRWNAQVSAWDRESDWGQGFQRQPPEHDVDVLGARTRMRPSMPDAEDLRSAVTLVEDLRRQGMCGHCEIGEISAHAIALDVWGEPALLCIFRPDPSTVESSGGTGRKKHWGHPNGCPAVGRSDVLAEGDWIPLGTYLYGVPMTTHAALQTTWCSKCTQAALNTRANVLSRLKNEATGEPSPWQIRAAMIEHRRELQERFQR